MLNYYKEQDVFEINQDAIFANSEASIIFPLNVMNDIAEKTTNVVELTGETYERTTNCRDSAQKLRAITSRFKL